MKILHIADAHLGLAPSGARFGEAAGALRRARAKALARAVEFAAEREADVMLVAGDLFDSEHPDAATADAALGVLARSGVPVAVIPGNHDPATPRSVWERPPWDSPPENVMVLREARPVERPWGLDLVLYPCPLLAKDGSTSPVAWIAGARAEHEAAARYHVGLAHGTIMRMPEFADKDFPIEPDDVAVLGLDYLALGHWHGFTPATEAAAKRYAYSGTTEPAKFGDPEGGALLVELGGDSPKIGRVATGGFIFRDESMYVAEAQDVSALADRILRSSEPRGTVLRVKLKGTAPLAAFEQAQGLGGRLADAGFLHVEVDCSELGAEPQDIELARLPRGPLRRALEILLEGARDAGDDDRDAAQRAVALAWEMFGTGG
ncbi:MAG: metallophosphoesterase family protein [Planctomycetota bacterium]